MGVRALWHRQEHSVQDKDGKIAVASKQRARVDAKHAI